MHAVGFDKNRDAILGFTPPFVRRNEAASQCGEKIEPDDKKRPADNGSKSTCRAVDPKKFQV